MADVDSSKCSFLKPTVKINSNEIQTADSPENTFQINMLGINSKKTSKKRKKELNTDHDYLKGGKAKTKDAHPVFKQPIEVHHVPETLLSHSRDNCIVDTIVDETNDLSILDETVHQIGIMNQLLNQLKPNINSTLKNKVKNSNSNKNLQTKIKTHSVNFFNTPQQDQEGKVESSIESIILEQSPELVAK